MSGNEAALSGDRCEVQPTRPSPTRGLVRNRHVVLAGSLLLLVPNIVFAATLAALPAALMMIAAFGFLALSWRTPLSTDHLLSRPLALGRFSTCLVLSLVLLVLGGEMHLFYANSDWLWRDAVFADIARGPHLPTYQVAGTTFLLRAPLGMYLMPALIARASNLVVGHLALLAQNALFLACVLYMLATMAGRHAMLVLVVFLGFSGLDVLGQVFIWVAGGREGTFQLPSHIEWWAGSFQYSSVVTQLFWCPNHALPAYWLTVLALLCSRREIDVASLGIAAAASLLWSPFAVLGILPFAVYLVLSDHRAIIASKRSWLAAAVSLTFFPVALYLQADAARVPHEVLLFVPGTALLIIVFLAVEIPHVAIVGAARRRLDPALRGLVCVALPVLVALPTVRVGLANDFVMRASIPALMILAVAFAAAMADAWPTRPVSLVAGAVLILLGAVTPFQEVSRSFSLDAFELGNCNLVTVWKKIGKKQPTLENYLAKKDSLPPWLLVSGDAAPLVEQSGRTCWPSLSIDPYLRVTRSTISELKRFSRGYKPL